MRLRRRLFWIQQNARMRGHSVGLMLRQAVGNFGFAVAYLVAVGRGSWTRRGKTGKIGRQ